MDNDQKGTVIVTIVIIILLIVLGGQIIKNDSESPSYDSPARGVQ